MVFDQESIFDIVEVLLNSKGQSFRDLSKAISIPYQTLQNYRHSRSKLSAEALFLIAQYLEVETDHLLGFRSIIDIEALSRALAQTLVSSTETNFKIDKDTSRELAIKYFDHRTDLMRSDKAILLMEKDAIHELNGLRHQEVVNNRLTETLPETDD